MPMLKFQYYCQAPILYNFQNDDQVKYFSAHMQRSHVELKLSMYFSESFLLMIPHAIEHCWKLSWHGSTMYHKLEHYFRYISPFLSPNAEIIHLLETT